MSGRCDKRTMERLSVIRNGIALSKLRGRKVIAIKAAEELLAEVDLLSAAYSQQKCLAKPGPADWSQIVGKWPGDETDEEIQKALDEIS